MSGPVYSFVGNADSGLLPRRRRGATVERDIAVNLEPGTDPATSDQTWENIS